MLIGGFSAFSQEEEYKRLCDSCLKYSFSPCNSEVFIDKALEIALENDFEIHWKIKTAQAWKYFYEKKFDTVGFFIPELSKHIINNDTCDEQLSLLRNIANLQLNLAYYSNAYKSFTQLLETAKINDNKFYMAKATYGLEATARSTGDIELAIRHLETLLEYLKDVSIVDKGLALQRYAENAIKREKFEIATKSLREALKVYFEINYLENVPNIYNQMGYIQNAMGYADSSLFYYNKSLESSVPAGRDILSADSYGNMGIIHFDKKEFNQSIIYFDSILNIAIRNDYDRYIRFGHYHLSKAYDSIGDIENAYFHFKRYSQLKDSLEKDERNQRYIEERTRFETEKKEQELEIISVTLRNQKIIFISALSVLILIIIVVVLLYRQGRLRNKQKLSEIEKLMAETRQMSLRQQMNPHFVFNTLNSIQYFMFRNEKMATNSYMNKFAMLIRKTLDNSQHNSIPVKFELEALQLYIELEQLRFKNSFSFIIKVDPEIDELQHKIPTMLIQPFVENSINHGLHYLDKDGKLMVELKLVQTKTIECIIEDNGIGREKAAEIKKVKHENYNSLGTSITHKRINAIESMAGNNLKIEYVDLKDKSKNPIGTRVIIQIPILTRMS
jgi:tetratricopeptide (TPR) repeat protein